MGGTARFRDDVPDPEFLQVQDGEERRFEVLADADDDAIGFCQRGDGSELLFAGAVGDNGLRDHACDVLDFFGMRVDDHDVMTKRRQVTGKVVCRISKTDNYELSRSHSLNIVILAHHHVFFGVPGGILKLACNGRYQEQGSHASDEHYAADDDFTDEGEFSRESHGEPTCGIGAHDFEEDLEERTGVFGIAGAGWDFGAEENQRGARDDDDGGDENSNGLVDGVVRDGASENLGLFPAEEPVEAEEAQDCSGCNLDAAATATRVCPDEHDDDKDEERCVREVGNVDGIQPCRAARKSHEQDGLCVFAKGVTAK